MFPKRKTYVLLLFMSISILLFFIYQSRKLVMNNNNYSNASSYSSGINFYTNKGVCHVICGVIHAKDSIMAQPMVVYFEKEHVVLNVISGWGYEDNTVFGLITLNNNTLKVPLGSVILVNPENKFKILSSTWDISIFGDDDKIENYVDTLLTAADPGQAHAKD